MLKTTLAQLLQKPANKNNSRSAGCFKQRGQVKNVMSELCFEPLTMGRLEHPLHGANSTCAPASNLHRGRSGVGLDSMVRQRAAPAVEAAVRMLFQASLSDEPVDMRAPKPAVIFKLGSARAFQVPLDTAFSAQKEFALNFRQGSVVNSDPRR